MTTYHLRNESGIEVFTGTISPAPGGGSQPLLLVSFVSTDSNDMTDSPPSGPATADTNVLTDGDRVLLTNQGNAPDNGVWVVNTTGLWTRPADYASGSTIPMGTLISIGTNLGENDLSLWAVTLDTVVDTDDPALTWYLSHNVIGFSRAGTDPIYTSFGGAVGLAEAQIASIAFFGKSPSVAVQPVVPLTNPGVQDVIDVLVAIGLVAQHD